MIIRKFVNRIQQILDENYPREQVGFQGGFSTTDHLHALIQLIEKANEYQLKLCVACIVWKKVLHITNKLNLPDK